MEKVNCVVCGATLNESEATKLRYENETYFACGPHIEEFKSNPTKYIRAR